MVSGNHVNSSTKAAENHQTNRFWLFPRNPRHDWELVVNFGAFLILHFLLLYHYYIQGQNNVLGHGFIKFSGCCPQTGAFQQKQH